MGGLDDDRNVDTGVMHPRKDAQAIEIRHDEIENDAVETLRPLAHKQRHGRISAVGQHGLVAGSAHHVFKQAPGNRIVIDDKDTLGHHTPRGIRHIVPFRGNVTKPD